MAIKHSVITHALATTLCLAAAGCASRLPPIALDGSPADLAQLAGSWSGEYISDTAREPGGSIVFSLAAGEDRAYGDVLMTRRGARQPFERFDPERPIGRTLGLSQSLTILIVRAHDGFLTGELDPYWDFDRECQAVTVFQGFLRQNSIEGTYETNFRGPFSRRTGKWRVVRSTTTGVK